MTPYETALAIAGVLERKKAVRALMLAGSHGSGTADAWSDLDFVALPRGSAAELADLWPEALAAAGTVVFLRRSGQGSSILVNAVTEDWLRIDLFVMPEAAFMARRKDRMRPLHDPEELHVRMSDATGPVQPDPARVTWIIEEFLRGLGLLPTVIGRGEYVTAAWGYGHLLDLLIRLMLLASPRADGGGALHPSRVLSPEEMTLLRDLPMPPPEREAVIAAHARLAAAFLPAARTLANRLHLDWPDAFEAAARAHLERHLGMRLP